VTVKSKTIAAPPQEFLHIRHSPQHHEKRRQLPQRRTVTDATNNDYAQPGIADRIDFSVACRALIQFWRFILLGVLSSVGAATGTGKCRDCFDEGAPRHG